jgi:hypothetical protein
MEESEELIEVVLAHIKFQILVDKIKSKKQLPL